GHARAEGHEDRGCGGSARLCARARGARRRPPMLVGATEDAVRSPTLVAAKAELDLAKLAGFDGVRITQVWAPGQMQISGDDLASLRNVTTAAALDNMTVLTSVLPFGSKTTPLTDKDQADFAA